MHVHGLYFPGCWLIPFLQVLLLTIHLSDISSLYRCILPNRVWLNLSFLSKHRHADMEQTRAINALAPFVALSKAASSPRAAADLVIQATSAQNTYIFAELLQTPPLQALRQDPQYASHYKLLEVFAWGTWEDYQGKDCL